jgi:hypothetical protein
MKHLLEVARLISRKRLRKIEILDDASLRNSGNMFQKLYEALMDQTIKNDRDAAKLIYGSTPNDDKYRQLKSRFKKRLLNTLFFLDINAADDTDYEQAHYTAHREWAIIKILDHHNAPETAVSLAKSNLTLAQKYKFADIAVNCARLLRDYAAREADTKQYAEYQAILVKYSDIVQAEIKAEELFHQVVALYNQTIEVVENRVIDLDNWCNSLVNLSEIYESPVVQYYMYLSWIYRFEMLNDYESMLEVCGRAEIYVSLNPSYHRVDLTAIFYLKKMLAFLHLKDYRRGRTNAEANLKWFAEGSALWFDFLEIDFLLSLHTGNYVTALSLLKKATEQPRYKKLSFEDRDRWTLFELYVQYVAATVGKDHPILSQFGKKSTRSTKLLNQDPGTFSKELRMLGLHVQIARVILLIQRDRTPEAGFIIGELKMQAERQFKKSEQRRALYFIRLLEYLAKRNFNPGELKDKPKYLVALEETPFRYRGLWSEMEIIPYEQLWTLIVSTLK